MVVSISEITLIYKNIQNKRKSNSKIVSVVSLAPESMSLQFCGVRSALLHNFAGQRMKAP